MNGATRSSITLETGGNFAIIFRRDCAWVAFDALAPKRSTNDCMWARLASIFVRMASCRRSFSMTCRSKLS